MPMASVAPGGNVAHKGTGALQVLRVGGGPVANVGPRGMPVNVALKGNQAPQAVRALKVLQVTPRRVVLPAGPMTDPSPTSGSRLVRGVRGSSSNGKADGTSTYKR